MTLKSWPNPDDLLSKPHQQMAAVKLLFLNLFPMAAMGRQKKSITIWGYYNFLTNLFDWMRLETWYFYCISWLVGWCCLTVYEPLWVI